MGLRLIFAVEADKKSKSDWIYMKDTIDYFYCYDQVQFKFSLVYMNCLLYTSPSPRDCS